MSQNHKHSGSACVHKSGVVPDKLCVFPADESYSYACTCSGKFSFFL